jgi:PadR family transcriptional regulator PadR
MEEQSRGILKIPVGTLYPTLYKLHENGYVGTTTEIIEKRLRTYYHIEPAGIDYLRVMEKDYAGVMTGVNYILDASKRER